MEVASPLTFGPASAGTKRHLSCSPTSFADSTNRNPFDEASTDDFMQPRQFKRRRFAMDESMDSENSSLNQAVAPAPALLQPFSSPQKIMHNPFKRSRTEATASTPQGGDHHHLQKVVESQAAEIESLKQEKSATESSARSLKQEHDRVVNENRILKRAVTIQQERQNQAAGEIDAARQYKGYAEEQIKKLEQIILSLRYHLQAQGNHVRNDFMGFPPQPPDVY